MAYNSVAEIFDSIDDARRRLTARLEGLNEAQQNFRPAPDTWSIAEIIEHLSITERQLVQLFQMMLKKIEAAGAGLGANRGMLHAPVSIEEFVEQSKREKYQAPENIRPTGGVPLADSLASLQESRAALRDLQPRLESVEASAARYPHPAFGPLDLYQWLLFVGTHEERHLGQIEALTKSPGFDAAQNV